LFWENDSSDDEGGLNVAEVEGDDNTTWYAADEEEDVEDLLDRGGVVKREREKNTNEELM